MYLRSEISAPPAITSIYKRSIIVPVGSHESQPIPSRERCPTGGLPNQDGQVLVRLASLL